MPVLENKMFYNKMPSLHHWSQFWCLALVEGRSKNSPCLSHTHTQARARTRNGSCWRGGQIKYLFPVSGECLDRAPLILSLWEPLVPWIMLSLRAPRQTGSHAPFCSMPRHQPTTSTPIFSDPPLRHRGRWKSAKRRERKEVRDEGGREGGDEKKSGGTDPRMHKGDRRNTIVPVWRQSQLFAVFVVTIYFFSVEKLQLAWHLSDSLAFEILKRHISCSVENKYHVVALVLESPGKLVARGWQMINIYVSIHTGTHQSIPNALSA